MKDATREKSKEDNMASATPVDAGIDTYHLLSMLTSLAAIWTKNEIIAWISMWCVVSGVTSMRRSASDWRNLLSSAAFSALAIYQTRRLQ